MTKFQAYYCLASRAETYCSRKTFGSRAFLVCYMVQWSDDVQQGPGRKGSNKAGPRLYEPQGKRFSLLHGASPTSRVFE